MTWPDISHANNVINPIITIITSTMKKLIFTCMAIIAMFASCAKTYEAKSEDQLQLATRVDSLNYMLGLANGAGVNEYMLRNDSDGTMAQLFLNKMDQAVERFSKDNNEFYKYGRIIGLNIQYMERDGLMGDSTLTLNKDAFIQGFVNALNNYDYAFTKDSAEIYLQQTMRRIRDEHLKAQQNAAAADNADKQAAQDATDAQ